MTDISKKLRIFLIAGDHAGEQRLLSELLHTSILDIQLLLTAGTLKKAISILQEEIFDIILLDLSLPDSFGIGTLKSVKIVSGNIPVIIISGLNDIHLSVTCIGQGAQDYLLKEEVDSSLIARSILNGIQRQCQSTLHPETSGINSAGVESKTAETTLQKSIRRFEMIAATTHDAIWEWNLETNEIWGNEMHQRLYGLTSADAVPTEKMWRQRIHPDDREIIFADIKKTLASDRSSWICEYRFQVPGGSYRNIYDRSYIVRNEKGEAIRIMGSMMDITEGKSAEEKIKRSEKQLLASIENTPNVAVQWFNRKGEVLFWNRASELIFGWKAEEAMGKTLDKLIHTPEATAEFLEVLKKMEQTGQPIGPSEYTFRRRDGSEGCCLSTIFSIPSVEEPCFVCMDVDITENKKSEEKYRTLVEQAVDAIALYDANGRILDVNTGSVNLLRYSKEELMQMSLKDILTAEEIQVKPVQYDVLQRGESTVKQRRMKRKDGSVVDTEVRSQQLPDGRFLSVIRDMTERLEAQQQIEKEKELSDSIISSLPGVFYFFDHTGKFIRWNKKFEEVTGYSTEEIRRMHPLDFFSGDDRENVSIRIAEVFEKGLSDAEANFTTKNGEKVPYYFTGASIVNNGILCLLGTGIDITLRKKTQDLILKEKELSNEIIDSIPGVFFLFDENLRYLRWNKHFEAMSGYSADEIRQLHPVNDFYDKTERIKVMEAVNEAFTKGIATVEANTSRKDGQKTPLYMTGKRITYEGKPCIIGTGIDISDRKSAEEEIKYSYEQIRRLTEHVQNIREEERSHIAREIHDELGQHLTVLKMDVSWLYNKIGSMAEQPVKDKISNLLDMLDGTVRTVRRISSELRPSLLDDLGLMAAIEWQLSEFEKRSDIQTRFIHPLEEMKLPDTVKTALFRIFQESLTNVARHSQAKKVTVTLTYKQDSLFLSIADNGRGFDNQKAGDRRTLGILGMNERTSMIAGTYEIESTPGKGTLVSVKVPFIKD